MHSWGRGLAIVWLALLAVAVGDAVVTGGPGFTAYDGEGAVDAVGQETRSGAGCEGPVLQVALLQLASRGTDSALLCSAQASAAGASRDLRLSFDHVRSYSYPGDPEDIREMIRSRTVPLNQVLTFRMAALPPRFRPGRAYLSLRFEPADDGAVTLESSQLSGSLGEWAEDPPVVGPTRLVKGGAFGRVCTAELVMLACLADVPLDEELLASREWWRARFAASRVEDPDALLAAACAFGDAGALRRLEAGHASWLRASDNTFAAMLEGGSGDAGLPMFLQEPGTAGLVDRALALVERPDAREALMAVRPPMPELQTRHILLLALVAVLSLIVACLRRPADAARPPAISCSALLLLGLAMFAPLAMLRPWLYLGVLLVIWLRRLPRGAAVLQRVLLAVSLACSATVVLRITGVLPDVAWLDTLVSRGSSGAWLLAGIWIVADPGRRCRWLYLLSVCALLVASFAIGLGRLGVPPSSGYYTRSVALTLMPLLLLAFCVFGWRRRAHGEAALALR